MLQRGHHPSWPSHRCRFIGQGSVSYVALTRKLSLGWGGLPQVPHADLPANNTFPRCPAPLASLCYRLDFVALVLHARHLGNYQLLPVLCWLWTTTAGFSPIQDRSSLSGICRRSPANCLVNFSLGSPAQTWTSASLTALSTQLNSITSLVFSCT